MKKKIKIELVDCWWPDENGEGFDEAGNILIVNGERLDSLNQDTGTIISEIFKHIGYDPEVIDWDQEDWEKIERSKR